MGAIPRTREDLTCERFFNECHSTTKYLFNLSQSLNEMSSFKVVLEELLCQCERLTSVFQAKPAVKKILLGNIGFQKLWLVIWFLIGSASSTVKGCIAYDIFEKFFRSPRLLLQFTLLEDKIRIYCSNIQTLLNKIINFKQLQHNELYTEYVSSTLFPSIFKVTYLISDSIGRQWWVENIGDTKFAVSWTEFYRQLSSHSDSHIRRIASENTVLEKLKSILVHGTKGRAVTALCFSNFLYMYGPGPRNAIIQVASLCCTPSWFVGEMSYAEAECVLAPALLGTFLIRFNESKPCSWAVAYKGPQTVEHSLITAVAPNPSSGEGSSYFVCSNRQYPSLVDFVQQQSKKLTTPFRSEYYCPASYFRGYVNRNDAEIMLEGQDVGTFLIRFSESRHGCLVVAYVDPVDACIKQSLIYCQDDTFELGGVRYNRISDILKFNDEKLKHPLMVEGISMIQLDSGEGVYGSINIVAEETGYGGIPLDDPYGSLPP